MTTYTKTVDPNGGADYASLALWEAGEQTLYSSGDVAIADCRRTGAAKDTSGVTIAGWTTGVIPKIIVHADYRHENKKADTRDSDGNYIYKIEYDFNCISLQVPNSEVHGITITNWGASGDRYAIGTTNSSDNCSVTGCLIYDPQDTASLKIGIHTTNGADDWFIYNNTILDLKKSSGTAVGIYSARGNLTANNTVYNCGTGFDEQDSLTTMVYKNNIGVGNSVADFAGSADASSDYNVSSDATAPGTTVATGQTSYGTYFVDHSNGDFHLTNDSETLFGVASADLSGTFTDDIEGDTRPASSSFGLGSDYYVSAALSAEVGLISDTNSGFSLSSLKENSVGFVTETSLVFELPTTIVEPVNITTETSTTLPATPKKTTTIGVVVETSNGFGLHSTKESGVGISSETNSLLPASPSKHSFVEQSLETDSVFILNSAKTQSTQLVSETNSSQTLGSSKTFTLGLPSESNSAFSPTPVVYKVREVGLVVDGSENLGLTSLKTKLLNQNSETNTSFSITGFVSKVVPVGLVVEGESVFETGSAKIKSLLQPFDTSSAFGISGLIDKFVQVGLISDSELTHQLSSIKDKTVSVPVGISTLFAPTSLKRKVVGQAEQTEQSLALVVNQFHSVGVVSESNTVFSLVQGLSLSPWVYTVEAEERIIVVGLESRNYQIPSETRIVEV